MTHFSANFIGAQRMPIKLGKAQFRFSVGPWNLHPGADPFGPPVRTEFSWERKL